MAMIIVCLCVKGEVQINADCNSIDFKSEIELSLAS